MIAEYTARKELVQMKTFEIPEIKITEFAVEDIIATSVETIEDYTPFEL